MRAVTAGDAAAPAPPVDPPTRPRDSAAAQPRDVAPRWAPNGFPPPPVDSGSSRRDSAAAQPRDEAPRWAPNGFPPPPLGYSGSSGYVQPGFAWSPGYAMPPISRHPMPGFVNPGAGGGGFN